MCCVYVTYISKKNLLAYQYENHLRELLHYNLQDCRPKSQCRRRRPKIIELLLPEDSLNSSLTNPNSRTLTNMVKSATLLQDLKEKDDSSSQF